MLSDESTWRSGRDIEREDLAQGGPRSDLAAGDLKPNRSRSSVVPGTAAKQG